MRLRLDLCGVDMQLKIQNWSMPCPDNECEWADTKLSLSSHYLNDDRSGEILLCSEIVDLCHTLDSLLVGNIENDYEIRFAEPDIEIKLHTAKRLYSIPGVVYYSDGYIDRDISIDLCTNFWGTGGFGTNQLKVALDRKAIEALCIYLKTVIGELSKEDPAVEDLLRHGLLLPE